MVLRNGFVCLCFSCIFLHASAMDYDFDDDCRKAYDHILALKFDEGRSFLEKAKAGGASNLIPVFLEDYIDFLTIFINENRDEYQALKPNRDDRLKLLKKGDKKSPYYLYTQAEIHLHWAVAKVKFGDYFKAVLEIRKAFKLLEENRSKFPEFKATYKTLGLLHTVLGSIPDKYKWGLELLGMEGGVKLGLTELELVLQHAASNDFIFEDETVILYAFLLFHLEKKGDMAWTVLQSYGFPRNGNLMHVFTVAHIGVYSGKIAESIKVLEGRAKDPSYQPFPFLEYLLGLARLYRLDPGSAVHFQNFLTDYRGDNHIKSAHQKLAWFYLLQGDTTSYHQHLAMARNTGYQVIDADKQAFKEAMVNTVPNIALLKARILFDGGDYQKAAESLTGYDIHSFSDLKDQTELLYRKGRIYHEWGRIDQSILFYKETIETGKDLPYYYAANAALQLGYIYEAQGKAGPAEAYYKMCISFRDHGYKNSLDQKAKAGLNRLKSNFN